MALFMITKRAILASGNLSPSPRQVIELVIYLSLQVVRVYSDTPKKLTLLYRLF